MTENAPPNKTDWWFHRLVQSYLGFLGLISLTSLATIVKVDEYTTDILWLGGVGCIIFMLQYAAPSVKEIVMEWKGRNNE